VSAAPHAVGRVGFILGMKEPLTREGLGALVFRV